MRLYFSQAKGFRPFDPPFQERAEAQMNSSSPCRILPVEDDPSDAHLVRQASRSARNLRFDIAWVTSLAAALVEASART